MKTYTIYDNLEGGFTIWWKYYDKYNNKYVKKSYNAINKDGMMVFRRELERNGYKFVGKI
jgi:hypothetical protein